MSVGTLTVQLPSRASWWIKHVAIKQKCTERQLIERWLLEKLNATPGVDLSRSPAIGE